jgi:hypothetical protein
MERILTNVGRHLYRLGGHHVSLDKSDVEIDDDQYDLGDIDADEWSHDEEDMTKYEANYVKKTFISKRQWSHRDLDSGNYGYVQAVITIMKD